MIRSETTAIKECRMLFMHLLLKTCSARGFTSCDFGMANNFFVNDGRARTWRWYSSCRRAPSRW
uniref:Uncharacterized protein n=1 Tax=Arundo donax TaxID=35708 RepID=A0A0A9AD99_ARUDO